jgi:deoxyadenosine/deoxycytidine kinase
MTVEAPTFIAVEGPIGVGKTSLVRRLAETYACDALLERAEENPFLERFYRDRASAAFATQMHFLMQRNRQLEQLRQHRLFSSRLVADFLFAKDRLFAELNLQSEELALYNEVYRRLAMHAPRPDLVLYLQAPVEVLMARVRKRARPQEQTLSSAYLQRVTAAYTDFFYRYDEAPVLVIDAASINPLDSEADYRAVLEALAEPFIGKRYFNPPPLAIH